MAEKSTSKKNLPTPIMTTASGPGQGKGMKNGTQQQQQNHHQQRWFDPDFLNPACIATTGREITSDLTHSIVNFVTCPTLRKTSSECKTLDSPTGNAYSLTADSHHKGKKHRRRRGFKGCRSSSSWAPRTSSNSEWPKLDDLIPRDPHRTSDSEIPSKTSPHSKKHSKSLKRAHPHSVTSHTPEDSNSPRQVGGTKTPTNRQYLEKKQQSPKSDNPKGSPTTLITEPNSPSSSRGTKDHPPQNKSNLLADCSTLFPSVKAACSSERRKGPAVRLLSTKLSQTNITTCSNQTIKVSPKLSDTKLLNFSDPKKLARQLTAVLPTEGVLSKGLTQLFQDADDAKLEAPEINPLNNSPFFENMESPVVLEHLEIKKFNNNASPFFERKASTEAANISRDKNNNNIPENQPSLPAGSGDQLSDGFKCSKGSDCAPHIRGTEQLNGGGEEVMVQSSSENGKRHGVEFARTTDESEEAAENNFRIINSPNKQLRTITRSLEDSRSDTPRWSQQMNTSGPNNLPPHCPLDLVPLKTELDQAGGDDDNQEKLVHIPATEAISSTTVILSSTTILNTTTTTTVVVQKSSKDPSDSCGKTVEVTRVESVPSSPRKTDQAVRSDSKTTDDIEAFKLHHSNGADTFHSFEAKRPGRRPPLMRKTGGRKGKLPKDSDEHTELSTESRTSVLAEGPEIIFEDGSVSDMNLLDDPKLKNKLIWVPTSFFQKKGSKSGSGCNYSSSSLESQPGPDLISGGNIDKCRQTGQVEESSSSESCNTFILRGVQSVEQDDMSSEDQTSASSSSSTTEIHMGETQYFLPVLTRNEQKSCIRPVRRGDSKPSIVIPHSAKTKSVSCKNMRYHGGSITRSRITCTTAVLTSSTRPSRRKGPRILKLFGSPVSPSQSVLSVLPSQALNNKGNLGVVGPGRRKSGSVVPQSGILLLPAIATKDFAIDTRQERAPTTPVGDAITKFELDPILAFRIPSFELIPVRRIEEGGGEGDDDDDEVGRVGRLEGDDQEDIEEVSRMNIELNLDERLGQGHRDDDDGDEGWSRKCKDGINNHGGIIRGTSSQTTCVPLDMLTTLIPSSEESVKIMKEAEIFLTEYRNPGSPSFGHKLPQFAAYYDRLAEASSPHQESQQYGWQSHCHHNGDSSSVVPVPRLVVPVQPSLSSSTNVSYSKCCSKLRFKTTKKGKKQQQKKKNHTCKLSRLAKGMSCCRRNFSLRKMTLSRPFRSFFSCCCCCCCRQSSTWGKLHSQPHYSSSLSKVSKSPGGSASSHALRQY